jgi:hypothetical protein
MSFKTARTGMLTMALATAALGLFAASPIQARDFNERVAVPSEPDQGDVHDCWTANRSLYGPYKLTFCLRSGYTGKTGSYQVTGGGMRCDGALNWGKDWTGGYWVHLSRSYCGGGTDWSADRMTCNFKPEWDPYAGRNRVFVPTPSRRLTCLYQPVVWGYKWTTFEASPRG